MRLVTSGGRVASRTRPGLRASWRLTVTLASALLIAGCRMPFGPSAAGAPAVGTLTVVASPEIGNAPLYIAQQEGMFRAAGLTVKIIKAADFHGEVAALQNGSAQVAFGDYADMFYTQQKLSQQHQRHGRAGLALVADGYDAAPSVMEVLTLPNSGISTPGDLVGKTIGTTKPQVMPMRSPTNQPIPFSLETVATQSVLLNQNVDPSKITWLPMPSGGLLSALKSGQVSAILATEPTIYQAETQLGAVPVVDSCSDYTGNLPLGGYFSLDAYATEHPAAITAFRAALIRAQAAATQAQLVHMALVRYDRFSPTAAALVTIGEYPTTIQERNLQRVASLMFSFDALSAPVNVKSMLSS